MAGYRRFVIYLYWCRKENIQNAGFTKIELQNNQCRIEMHLKGLPQKEQALPVYLFHRDENSEDGPVLWGVELGEIEIKHGAGKFGRIFPVEKIGGSSFRYQDMNGILIPLNTEEMIAGQWDNKDIIQQQFRVWPPETENNHSGIRTAAEENTDSGSKTAAEENTDPALKTDVTEHSTAESMPPVSKSILKENHDPEKAIEQMSELSSEETIEQMSELSSEEAIEQMSELSSEKEKTQPDSKDTLRVQQLAYDFEDRIPNKVRKKNFAQETASDWEQMWKMLSSRRDVFAPMEEKDILAVRIDLKDLHLLPEDLWNLGNNSFLLHGFFNYRFLLYGRIHQENGASYYFIGIPGVFSNQEKVLAAIFGFPEFYLEKKAEIRTGKSGYWCKLLMSSDSNAYK